MVNYNQVKYFRAALLLVLLFMAACSTRKKAEKVQENEVLQNDISSQDALSKSRDVDFQFNRLSLKGDGKFESKKEQVSFTYRIQMVKDSAIWFSVTKMGYEALRALITPDSIQVLDRLSRKYAVADYSLLRKLSGMDLDFRAIENLLLGNIGYMKDSLLADSRSKIPHRFLGKKDSTQFSYVLSGENFKITRMEAENLNRNQKSFVTYARFEVREGFLLPQYLLLTVVKPERNQLELTHSRIERNPEPAILNFSIPDNYARVQIP